MKRLALLLLLSATVFSTYAQDEKWRTLKSSEGEFRMKMPGEWEAKRIPFGPPETPTTLHINEYNSNKETPVENVRYAVSWADLQQEINVDDHAAVQNIFDGQIDRVTSELHGGIPVSDQVTRYQGYPGLDVELNYDNERGKIFMRMFLVHNRLYLLEVTGMAGAINRENLDRFFESLEIKF